MSLFQAISLFFCNDLDWCTRTSAPVGTWRSLTAFLARLTLCPPGPDPLATLSSTSLVGGGRDG